MDDEWFERFCGKAGPRLQSLFSAQEYELPAALAELLQQLRDCEAKQLRLAA
jgi:hypothetical protein